MGKSEKKSSKKKSKKHKREKKSKKKSRKRSRSSSSEASWSSASPFPKKSSFGELGYSNAANPFGDSQLSTQFVWKAKNDKTKREGKKKESRLDRERKQELRLLEIAKVRARREEREQSQAERERLRDEENRLRELQQYANWEEKEEEFHVQQQVTRSKIRILENRLKPIDVLARNLLVFQERKFGVRLGPDGKPMQELSGVVGVSTESPLRLFDTLNLDQVNELKREVVEYEKHPEQAAHFAEFWAQLRVLCDARIKVLTNRPSHTLHATVSGDIDKMLSGKDLAGLRLVEQQVKARLVDREEKDPAYWEAVQSRVRQLKAESIVQTVHEEMLREEAEFGKKGEELGGKKKKNEQIEREKEKEKDPYEDAFDLVLPGDADFAHAVDFRQDLNVLKAAKTLAIQKMAKKMADQGVTAMDLELDNNPESASSSNMNAEMKAEMARIQREFQTKDDPDLSTERQSNEIALPSKPPSWAGKYQARKPKFFNRVLTGYDWNKYNRSHYDTDNPPPKVVQGYKFNLFYPDLVDKTKTPRFKLEPTNSEDFVILRFHAGPPYEDVAFKIVNKEWETVPRKGFVSTFERGVLRLNFKFKRFFYRR